MSEYTPVALKGDASAQEVFEAVVTHLFKQGKQSIVTKGMFGDGTGPETGSCMYRGENGSMCAIGCVLPNETYTVAMENKTIFSLKELAGSNLPAYFNEHEDLLDELQTVHDHKRNWNSDADLKASCEQLGTKYGLDIAFMKDLRFNN